MCLGSKNYINYGSDVTSLKKRCHTTDNYRTIYRRIFLAKDIHAIKGQRFLSKQSAAQRSAGAVNCQ